MMTKTLWITKSWHRPEALCLTGGTCCSRRRAARLCSAGAGVTHQLLFPLDLVLYCEAFLTTYRTFITPEELIKKLQYRYPSGPTLAHTSHTQPSTAPLQGKAGSSCPLSHPVVGSGWGCSALLCHVLSGTSGQPSSLSLLPVCDNDRAEVRFCEVPGTECCLAAVVITGCF